MCRTFFELGRPALARFWHILGFRGRCLGLPRSRCCCNSSAFRGPFPHVWLCGSMTGTASDGERCRRALLPGRRVTLRCRRAFPSRI